MRNTFIIHFMKNQNCIIRIAFVLALTGFNGAKREEEKTDQRAKWIQNGFGSSSSPLFLSILSTAMCYLFDAINKWKWLYFILNGRCDLLFSCYYHYYMKRCDCDIDCLSP